MHRSRIAVALFTVIAGITASAQSRGPSDSVSVRGSSTQSLPMTAAGRAADAWLDAWNRGDSASFTSLVRAWYAPQALGGRSETSIATREQWRAHNLGAARVVRVDSSTDSTISVLVFHPGVDGWGHLTIHSAGNGDARIRAVSLTRMEEPPRDLAPRGRLGDVRIADELDAFVQRLSDEGRFSGTVGVVHDGRILLTRAYGLADRAAQTPATTQTRFELASVGKMFTAVVIARLVEDKRLSYDDTIGRWIPDYPNAIARRSVTLRHLLTHSSGIGDYFLKPEWERLTPTERDGLSLEDHLRFFASDSLSFTPGSRAEYRNSNYLLLGLVAQRATGVPFEELYRRIALDRASMSSTWRRSDPGPRARGYTYYGPMRTLRLSGGAVLAVDEPAMGSPAGGGTSTVDDMLKFATALGDGRLISRAAVDTMVARHGIAESATSWAGYGFDAVDVWRGVRVANKSGNTYGAHSQLDFYPDEGYAVVVLSNLETWAPEAIVYKARELITRR